MFENRWEETKLGGWTQSYYLLPMILPNQAVPRILPVRLRVLQIIND
jgi:hypothetical protein